jgi:polyisoprenoid-binding protein YceI
MLKKFSLLLLLCLFSIPAGAFAPTHYSVDAGHSNVGFSIPILNGVSQVRGKFNEFTVNLEYDDADITKSTVSATIKAASIDTGIERRDAHLRTADFFDVEKYPEITFQSTKIMKKGKDFSAIGTFTMHGVTKEIEIPFTANGSFVNEANKTKLIGFTGKIDLNRRDYGMTWKNNSVPDFVGDIVHVDLVVLLRTQPPK